MVEHEVAYTKEREQINIRMSENKLRRYTELYLDRELKIPCYLAGGDIQALHFRTKVDYIFENGIQYVLNEGMSYYHVKIQEEIRDKLNSLGVICELEKRLPEIQRIADIYFEYEDKKYVIEVQRSQQSVKQYKERSESYESIGIKYVWLCLPIDEKSKHKKGFSFAKAWNKDCELYITEKDCSLNKIKKIYNKDLYIYDEDCGIDEFINWFYERDFGITCSKNIIHLLREKRNYDFEIETKKSIIYDLLLKHNKLINNINRYEKNIEDLREEELELISNVAELSKGKFKLTSEKEKEAKEEYINFIKSNDSEYKKLLTLIKSKETEIKEKIEFLNSFEEKINKLKKVHRLWSKDLDAIRFNVAKHDGSYPKLDYDRVLTNISEVEEWLRQ